MSDFVSAIQLDRDSLLWAYTQMSRIRAFEDAVQQCFSAGEIPGFVHLYSGQEACAVGVCFQLDDTDHIGSTHRGHGHCIAKGCDIDGMMLEIFGKAGGLCGGKGGSMHIADMERGMLGANAIVGGSAPLAIGAALTAKTLGTRGLAVAFTGDGGSNQGAVFEAMNMAVVLKLPVVFALENNGYGEATGVEYAVGAHSIAARAEAFGMPAAEVDGTDFFAVHDAMSAASVRARSGDGPTFLELTCTRHHGHFCGDPQTYRQRDEIEQARNERDPLIRFRKRVTQVGLLQDSDLNTIDAAATAEVASAVEKARAASFPTVEAALADVYRAY